MAARPLDDAAIDRILSAQGIDPRRADDPALNAQLTRNHALAASLGIDATPTFVLGDQVFPGLRNDDVGTLRPIIEAAKRAAR
jgi:protein-disulfide isomerase